MEAAPGSREDHLPYTLELCGNRAGYEVTPRGRIELDLGEAQGRLVDAGFTVLTNAGILVVAQLGPVEVSVFESGRLLLKTKDREMADAVTRATYRTLGVTP